MKFNEISDSEWQIMKIIWHNHPQTLSGIVDAVIRTLQWNPKTIQTLLGRLVKKGVVGKKQLSPRRYEYFPLVSENDYKQSLTKSFVSQVYDGKLSMLISAVVDNETLTIPEMKKLMQILDEVVQ